MSRRKVLLLVSISLLIAFTSMLLRNFIYKSKNLTMSSPLTTTKIAIVVGSGLAGLSAASQLISHGVTVHLLERAAKPGGNSIKASSGINGAPTKYQPGPPFSDSFFYADSVKSAGSVIETMTKERESLIKTLTGESASAIEWLVNQKGVDLSLVAQLGGHSFPRTHRGAGKTPPGFAIVSTLLKDLKADERFSMETECTVTNVLKNDVGVEGVEYVCSSEDGGEKKILHGPVVFASGGFAGDAHGMLAQYRPDLAGFPSTNDPRPGSQELLTSVGAQTIDMEQVQVHPTSFVDPKDLLNPVKFLAAELLRGEGGLLLHDGKRFVNEMETRKNVTDAITRTPTTHAVPRQWGIELVLDEGVYENASSHIDFYIFKGLMRKATISDLGPSALETIKAYTSAAEGQTPDPFHREYFGHWKLVDVTPESVVYVGIVTPAVHFTMGGVVINAHSEVLDKNGKPIKGLWAAGEVTGGVHGENRLGGSSLLECVVFGRRAGDGAAKYLGGNL
jgi:FAD-dependent fumarate reductase